MSSLIWSDVALENAPKGAKVPFRWKLKLDGEAFSPKNARASASALNVGIAGDAHCGLILSHSVASCLSKNFLTLRPRFCFLKGEGTKHAVRSPR